MQTAVDKKDILIGEQITYQFSINLPDQTYKVAFNIPDSLSHFDVVQKTAVDTVDKNGQYQWQQKIIFTSFDSGSWTFPPLSYKINHLNTASQVLYTDTFRVNVGYMPLDKNGTPRDIKSIVEVEFFDWFWVYVGAAILVGMVLLFFIIRYIIKRKKNKPVLSNALSAYEEAMEALAQLQKANENASISTKQYHTSLATIFKNYCSKKSKANLQSSTTAEVLRTLQNMALQATTAAQTAEALQTGDAVKFAKYHPSYTENEVALSFLKNTINEIEQSSLKQ
ncbi:hypothetical protein ACFOWM_06030 [Ferruginibacter yonginensis]|uniref:Protein BatD n=1 Tax=Ferruginibacter yonginensis TaxID=1310416 RepID=A0ABV8QU12_9BACT